MQTPIRSFPGGQPGCAGRPTPIAISCCWTRTRHLCPARCLRYKKRRMPAIPSPWPHPSRSFPGGTVDQHPRPLRFQRCALRCHAVQSSQECRSPSAFSWRRYDRSEFRFLFLRLYQAGDWERAADLAIGKGEDSQFDRIMCDFVRHVLGRRIVYTPDAVVLQR